MYIVRFLCLSRDYYWLSMCMWLLYLGKVEIPFLIFCCLDGSYNGGGIRRGIGCF